MGGNMINILFLFGTYHSQALCVRRRGMSGWTTVWWRWWPVSRIVWRNPVHEYRGLTKEVPYTGVLESHECWVKLRPLGNDYAATSHCNRGGQTDRECYNHQYYKSTMQRSASMISVQ